MSYGAESYELVFLTLHFHHSPMRNQNQDGYCILDGKAPVCDIDRNVLNSWLVSYGWQPVGIYQVKENGKLAKNAGR